MCPSFWRANLKSWFAQIKAWFQNASILTDITKHNTITGAIENDNLSQFRARKYRQKLAAFWNSPTSMLQISI